MRHKFGLNAFLTTALMLFLFIVGGVSPANAQTCPSLTPTIYAPSQVILNLDANLEESIRDVNGIDATDPSFNGFVHEWINAEDLVGGPALTSPDAGMARDPAYIKATTSGNADNYLDFDGSDDTLQYTANLLSQSFTVYFALQSFLPVGQSHTYKSFMSTGTDPNVAGTWQLDMSNGGNGIDNCPSNNYFSWRMNDGGTHYRLCGRPLDNNVHSFYLTYNATTNALQSAGFVTASLGFSGSLTNLTDGTSFIKSGTGINVVSSSNGAITLKVNKEMVFNELLSGNTDGTNTLFTLANTPFASSEISIFVNGQLQTPPDLTTFQDYSVTGSNVFFTTGSVPDEGSVVMAMYNKVVS